MHTFIDTQDDERECICNFGSDSLILDFDNEKIYCSICESTALMPSYWDFLTQKELFEYYLNPKKKVFDFGEHGINISANAQVINVVRGHLGLLPLT